jgi:hypothetical protein
LGLAPQEEESMICAFWNSRSISAPGRIFFIDDNIVPLQLVYVGFQETKKECFSNTFLRNLLGETLVGITSQQLVLLEEY